MNSGEEERRPEAWGRDLAKGGSISQVRRCMRMVCPAEWRVLAKAGPGFPREAMKMGRMDIWDVLVAAGENTWEIIERKDKGRKCLDMNEWLE